MKRITAWILLVGFVLLLVNLIVFRYQWQMSIIAYLMIVFVFIFTMGNRNK